MDFSQALLDWKAGKRRTRTGWNGAKALKLKMFVVSGGGDTVTVSDEDNNKLGLPDGTVLERKDALFMFVDGTIFPYMPSRADLYADDWEEC